MPGLPTACGQASCANGVATTQGSCDGQGTCAGGQTRSCGQFQCDATACKAACASDLDCVAPALCSASICVPAGALDAGLPGLDASPDDATGQPDGAGPTRFHVVGGGCKCNLVSAASATSPAWLAVLAIGALLIRRRRR